MAIDDPSWPRADRWLARGSATPDVVVAGVPTAAASLSPSSAEHTPDSLRRALGRFSTYHGEWDVDLSKVDVLDAGDLAVSGLDRFALERDLTALASGLPEAPLRLYVGGDNAITRPLVRSCAHDLAAVGVLTFDAHHDVRTLDRGPTNGTPIRGLVEDGLPGDHVAQIGIHSFANSLPYRRYCEEQGIRVFTVADVERDGIGPVVDRALGHLSGRCRTIYVDVDVDVLDRAFAPGCPGARPGGLDVRALAEGVRRCGRHPLVSAADFVEVDPGRDTDGMTIDALATVFLSFVAGYAERREPWRYV
jgi:formimidoylglutamase